MTGREQEPRRTEDLGKGTATRGRLTKGEPLKDDFVVGHHGPPFEVTGVDALSPLLEHVEFPATTDDVKERIGNVRIPIDSARTKTVTEVMDDVGPQRFQAPADVHRAVNHLWDAIGEREGRGGRHRNRDDASGRPGNP